MRPTRPWDGRYALPRERARGPRTERGSSAGSAKPQVGSTHADGGKGGAMELRKESEKNNGARGRIRSVGELRKWKSARYGNDSKFERRSATRSRTSAGCSSHEIEELKPGTKGEWS